MTNEFFEITCPIGSSDAKLFTKIINQGIDSHLEAFVKSKFSHSDRRLILNFHKSEVPLLIRRLNDLGTEVSEMWASDIHDTFNRKEKE